MTGTLREVRLYGHLARQFGRVHRFAVASPAEAVRALIANFIGFEQAVLAHDRPGYRVWCGGQALGTRQLADPAAGVIRIAPVVVGLGKKKGIGQIILGVALIGASIFLPIPTIATAGGTVLFGASTVASLGFSLVLGGLSSLLFAPPKTPGTPERPDNKPSYAFDGPVNTAAQGNAVPVCYGRMRVGSQVISAGLSVEQIA